MIVFYASATCFETRTTSHHKGLYYKRKKSGPNCLHALRYHTSMAHPALKISEELREPEVLPALVATLPQCHVLSTLQWCTVPVPSALLTPLLVSPHVNPSSVSPTC